MEKIGKYKIEKIISNKKYTQIYVCSLKNQHDLFKIRAINKDMPNYEQYIVEAQCVNDLNVDRVPKFFEKIEDEQNVYFVYEFINGISLEKYLDINGYISESKAYEFMNELIEILKDVYEKSGKRLIHRKIKADNIVIDNDGRLNIIDFHISRVYDCKIEEKQVSIKPDLLGLGVTILYAVTGYNILLDSNQKNPLKDTSKGLSAGIRGVISKLLDEDYEEYDELLGEIKEKNTISDDGYLKKIAIALACVLVVIVIISIATHNNIFSQITK